MQRWLAKRPPLQVHCTPTCVSWLNRVERFLRAITTERLPRGVFTSVPEWLAAIDERSSHHSIHPKPLNLDQERTRHPAKAHRRQWPLKFQTE